MTEYTAHFRLPIPDFTQEPWHDEFETLCRAIDTMAYEALLANSSAWANDTSYAVGQIVLDETNGLLYVCAVAHISPAFPTTFLTFRNANPSYWNPTVQLPQQRGTWTTGTIYFVGDFVIDNNRYAVCTVSHTSTVFNADLSNGFWSVLIDVSGVADIGINTIPEVSIAAGPTVNLGGTAATRIFCTGTGETITSFGTVAEKFKFVRFGGNNTITHHATTLILLDSQNFLTRPNDVLILQSNSLGNWREVTRLAFARDDARGFVELATDAEAVTATDATRALTPASGKAQFDNRFFPSGTKMVFRQSTAPTGWVKDVVHDDKAMRIVNGSIADGGTVAFSTVFGRTATDNYTLVNADIPAHDHDAFIGEPLGTGHGHPGSAVSGGSTTGPAGGFTNTAMYGTSTSAGQALAIALGLTGVKVRSTAGNAESADNKTATRGGGGAHAHAMDIRVQYLDFIIATKV